MDFQDGGCLPAGAWLGGRLRVLYESSLEIACVCLLSELLFMGFNGWAVIADGTGVVGRVFTRVHESLRAFAFCLNCSSSNSRDGL